MLRSRVYNSTTLTMFGIGWANTYVYARTKSMSTISFINNLNFVKDGKKIVGAALNYLDVVKARNVPVPQVPLLFLKPTSSYIQEGEKIVIPRQFNKVAHEVELGVIIGLRCKNVSEKDAMKYVAGYCLALDMTAQDALTLARASGQPWSLGKGFDTATPVSRFIPSCDVKDPHNLELWLKVNGEMKQCANTQHLIFNVPYLVSYASKYMTLEPNDVILTGTPDGSAPVAANDVIECGLGDLVTLKFDVIDEKVEDEAAENAGGDKKKGV